MTAPTEPAADPADAPDAEDDTARIEVHRDGRHLRIVRTATGDEVRLTARQAAAVAYFLTEIVNVIRAE